MMTVDRLLLPLIFVVVFLLLFCVVWQYDLSLTFIRYNKIGIQSSPAADTVDGRNWNCRLVELDPWHPSIRRYLDRNKDPQLACHPTAYKYTDMVDGRLVITNRSLVAIDDTIRFRCLYPYDDHNLVFGDWRILLADSDGDDNKPNCDVIEVETMNDVLNLTTYRYLHTNIYRPPIDEVEKPKANSSDGRYRPSVIILVLDSTSSSEAIRSLSETMQVLAIDYKAVNFRYLNKVGINSRANGHAFLTGQRVDEIGKGFYGDGASAPSERPNQCTEYLDNSTFIGHYFRDNHYTTLMAEDWATGVFNWPNCSGFRRQPTTHYMRPFQLRTDTDVPAYINRPLLDTLSTGLCGELYQYVMTYVKQFLRAYPSADTPKWSLVWLSELAHSDVNGLYHVDGYFADFFTEFRQQLDESFVIVMGDHGIRFTGIRYTDIGAVEDNNPMLTVALPSRLRSNTRLVDNLRANAQQLVTHYDVYATLLDIAMFAFESPASKYSNFHEADNVNERIARVVGNKRGASLLRPLPPPATRNCETLQIPSQFCICHMDSRQVANASSDPMSIRMAEYIVERLNRILIDANVSGDMCAPLQLHTVESSRIIDYKRWKIYNIRLSVLPSHGHFEAPIRQVDDGDRGFELMADKIPRVNRYANQGDCVKNSDLLRPVCYCRNKTKMATTTPSVIV